MKRSLFIVCSVCLAFSSTILGRTALAGDDDGQPHLDTERYRNSQETARAADAWLHHKEFQKDIEQVKGRREQVLKWTGVQFEVGERKIIDKPHEMPRLMKQWQNEREKEIFRLVQFPEKSGGGIESGRGLNALLESLGPAALQNSLTRRIKPDAALPLTEPSALIRVDRNLAEEMTLQENVLGARTVWQGNRRDPLDLDWPAILRDDRWKSYRERLEEARKKALGEIASSAVVSNETDAMLRKAVASLNKDFADFRRDWVSSDHAEVDRALEYQRICDGTRHIQKLVVGAYQFANLTPTQVSYREIFDGGSIEDYIAYLRRNNLRFAPAAPSHRTAYYKVFAMMVRYYLDEKLAVNLEREIDVELATVRQNDQEAIDAALGRANTAVDKSAIEILGLNMAELQK